MTVQRYKFDSWQFMSSSQQSINCLNAGLKALAEHDYRALHRIAMERIFEDKQDPAPYYLLAELAANHGNTAKAEELFSKAADLSPESARYLSAYAKILSLRSNTSLARDINEKAACLPITDAHVADTVGVIFSRTGLHEKAIPFFKLAIKLNPNPDNFYYNLGSSLQFLGEFEGAEQAYRETIDRNPNHVKAYSSLVALKKQTPETNELQELFGLFETHQDSAEQALHIGHAIAKTLEDMGQYEQSLTWLKRAKKEKKSELSYDFESYLEIFKAAREGFEKIGSIAEPSQQSPIFIVGLPRTGTTLVDRILSSHPMVQSCGELNLMAGLIKNATKTSSNFVLDVRTLTESVNINLASIGHKYWTETSPLRRNAARMTDKMPLNFFYAGLIHKTFPNARIIALRRGAMDSCLSNFRQLFSTTYSYYNYTYDLNDIARFYREFDSLMAYWRSAIPTDRFTEVHYENIVFNQETETRRLLDFCGLEWDERCMRFHENRSPVATASSVQVRQPLYSGSIGRWKKYGDTLNDLRSSLGSLAE